MYLFKVHLDFLVNNNTMGCLTCHVPFRDNLLLKVSVHNL